jgi:hypothetical protein
VADALLVTPKAGRYWRYACRFAGRENFDAEKRNERWLKVSIGLGRFESHMRPLVLQLGKLDTDITMSYLWVLVTREDRC